MILRESFPYCYIPRMIPVKNPEPALVVLPILPQPTDSLHTRQSQKPMNALRLQLFNSILIVLTPKHTISMRFILPLKTDNRQMLILSRSHDIMVEFHGKGMCCIHYQGDCILLAKNSHFIGIHTTCHTHSMH